MTSQKSVRKHTLCRGWGHDLKKKRILFAHSRIRLLSTNSVRALALWVLCVCKSVHVRLSGLQSPWKWMRSSCMDGKAKQRNPNPIMWRYVKLMQWQKWALLDMGAQSHCCSQMHYDTAGAPWSWASLSLCLCTLERLTSPQGALFTSGMSLWMHIIRTNWASVTCILVLATPESVSSCGPSNDAVLESNSRGSVCL